MNDIAHGMRTKMGQLRHDFRTVSIAHLAELQDSVGRLVREGLLDERLYGGWHFYLKTNDNLPEARTIVIVAMPQPFASVLFLRRGITYIADIPPTYFTREAHSRAEEILANVLQTAGYKVATAHLAMKTLAVRSGLAKYGRNSISYVPGMGSLLQLAAFYTDWPCEQDDWQQPEMMDICENCSLCREDCPTGSIRSDRFLIHAEDCLGSIAEREPDSAPWVRLQPDWRNALIGCMRCQVVCPANRSHLQWIATGPSFREEETALMLDKAPWEQLSPAAQRKLAGARDPAGLYSFMAANLGALIEKQGTSPD